MIEWVHEMAQDWGAWMRHPAKGWPPCSLMGRIAEEGSVGAAIKRHVGSVPIHEMPEAALRFHRVFKNCGEQTRKIFWVMYAVRGNRDNKAHALGVSKSTMYRQRNDAHSEFDGEWSKLMSHLSQKRDTECDITPTVH